MLSDGRCVSVNDRDTPTTMSRRKIWKLSRSLVMLWIGYTPKLDLAGGLKGYSDSYKAAQKAGQKLKPYINHRIFNGPDRVRYSMYFVGYNPKLTIWMIDSECDMFTPIEIKGGMGTGAHGYNQAVTDEAISLLRPIPTD